MPTSQPKKIKTGNEKGDCWALRVLASYPGREWATVNVLPTVVRVPQERVTIHNRAPAT
jgi:hypothetical protein